MNIKLHTPKSLKAGSGMATIKQFLLSIVATSISIALTFGTAAILDNNKKQKEKQVSQQAVEGNEVPAIFPGHSPRLAQQMFPAVG